jgi:hypothetical protein
MQPTPWAGERTFHDLLYDWMQRAPWLAISAAAHLLLFFVLAAIPWAELREEEPVVIHAHLPTVVEVPYEPPAPPPEPELQPLEPTEPALQTAELPPDAADAALDAPSEPASAVDWTADPFAALPQLGIGGGFPAGGHWGGRGVRGNLPGGSGIAPALDSALKWLAAHQMDDGAWDCDGFAERCGSVGAGACGGAGGSTHDVGVTGLAVLAFLGDGHTTSAGAYRDVVARAVAWLRAEQDPDTGLIGARASRDFLYDHAIATLALCEAYYATRSPLLRRPAQLAVNLILTARDPYGAWRYDLPSIGDADTSVTGWMVFALARAREAGLEGDFRGAFDGALAFLDEVTDPASGRTGYSARGELSSRTPANEHFPREAGEAMTAVGLLCRIFLGQTPADTPLLARQADLLRARPPVWDPEAHTNDIYYWYYATYALYQMGKPWWPAWEKALGAAVVDSQRTDGDARGSWDPECAWGFSGGRVYSTALMALALEVYFRYARVLGAR